MSCLRSTTVVGSLGAIGLFLAACMAEPGPAPSPTIDQIVGSTVGKADTASRGDTADYVLDAHLGDSHILTFERDAAEISPKNARFLKVELAAGQHLVAVARKADTSSIRPHIRLYWESEPVTESSQQAVVPMAADGDAVVVFSAPQRGMAVIYVADRHRSFPGSLQVDLVEMGQGSPILLPEGQVDARRKIIELAAVETEVAKLIEMGLLFEITDEVQAAGRVHAGDHSVRPGDLFADARAYRELADRGAVTLETWARASNLGWHVTGVRRALYRVSVELSGGGHEERAVLEATYGAFCTQLWQALRGEQHALR